MTQPEDAFARFEREERLACRGRIWTLVDRVPGGGCAGLDLWAETERLSRTLLVPFDRVRRAPASSAPRVVRAVRWLEGVRALDAGCHPAGGLRQAASAAMDLHAYQLEPALAVLRHGATRLLIADAVGLGKTVQAGLILAELARRSRAFRALVLVPAGLRQQWAEALRQFFALDAHVADASWLRANALDRPAGSNPWALPGIYLASQDFVKRPEVLRPIEDLTWDLLVVDEAHNISRGTDRRIAAGAAAARAERIVLLTATPPPDPVDLAALCAIGGSGGSDPPLVLFERTHADAGAPISRRSTLLRVEPTADERRMHELLERYTAALFRESRARGDALARLAAIVLRKRALSSAGSLARSVRRRMALLACRPDEAAAQLRLPIEEEDAVADDLPAHVLGAPGLAHATREQRWLALIAEAAGRAAGAESKIRVLRRLLARVREPAIVFTEYRDTLRSLSRSLAAPGRSLLVLHGGMPALERHHVHARFAREDAVLLATDAASEGLNLHARCRLIVHFELPWSLSRLEQRAGRVDRFGQRRRVHEIGLVAASTAERLVLEPLVRRANRLRASGTGARGLAGALTEARVADLVAGDAVTSQQAPAMSVGESAAALRLDLRDEAAVEVNRLAAARKALRGAVAGGGAHAGQRPVLASIRCANPALSPGLCLVYVISLRARDGREVHVESLTVQLTPGLPPKRRQSARELRSSLEGYRQAAGAGLTRTLSQAASRALDTAWPIHQTVVEALRERRAASRRLRTSASARLVQPGLFARRAIGSAPAPWTDAAQPGLDESAPGTAAHVLGVEIRLAAALLVSRR